MLGTALQVLALGGAAFFAFELGGLAALGLILCAALMFCGIVVERMFM
jgi:hypothetical protein|tara:strand:- start:17223 stop:17366 length:144 start_codon:yes stop_codon:yes gene_type:complete